KQAISDLNLDRVAAGFNSLDSTLKVNGNVIEINISTYQALIQKNRDLVEALAASGFQFKVLFPAIKEVDEAHVKAKSSVEDLAKAFGITLVDNAKRGMRELERELPSLKNALKSLKESIELSLAFDEVKIRNEAAQAIEGVIREYEEGARRLG